MSNNIRFESGSEYFLHKLLGDKNKLVIPDLQRDYCWGKDAWQKNGDNEELVKKELVTGFINDLYSLYNEQKEMPVTLGLIYGYELPQYHIQICDGQQRLTTLFLLLGFINLKAEGNAFKDYLISPDDSEPRLQYAIRESTLYFLNDLTQKVFVSNINSSLNDILAYAKKLASSNNTREINDKTTIWYFREYDLDPSIQNLLAALVSIDKWAKENCNSWESSQWIDFGNFLLQKLGFIYYDMKTRSQGEETYIVINTTGEPLSPVENIKPIVLGQVFDPIDQENNEKLRKQYSNDWEEREQWFWENRDPDQDKTSDDKSYQFLELYWQIGMLQQRVNPWNLFQKLPANSSEIEQRWAKFKEPVKIHDYFKAFKKMVVKLTEKSSSDNNKQNILLAILQSVSHGLRSNTRFNGKLTEILKGNEDWLQDIVLPATAFLVNYPETKLFTWFMCRLRKNYFDRMRKRNPVSLDEEKISGSYVNWRHIIQIIEHSTSEEQVFTFDTLGQKEIFIKNYPLNEWYGQTEKDLEVLSGDNIDVIEWGGHRALMGDLTPLVVRNGNGNIDIDATKKRWENLKTLSASIEAPGTLAVPDVSNWYRLYRVLTGIISLEHRSYTPNYLFGYRYSTVFDCKEQFAYISRPDFLKLLDADNVLYELKKQCLTLLDGRILSSVDSMNEMDASSLIKTFLFAKTLVNKGSIIDFYDEYLISADAYEINNNRITPNFPISLGNICCGYAYKYGWKQTGHYGPNFLDTTLDGIFVPCDGLDITADTIKKNTEMIKKEIALLKQELRFQDDNTENSTIDS